MIKGSAIINKLRLDGNSEEFIKSTGIKNDETYALYYNEEKCCTEIIPIAEYKKRIDKLVDKMSWNEKEPKGENENEGNMV